MHFVVQYVADDQSLLFTANKIVFLKMPCTHFGVTVVSY